MALEAIGTPVASELTKDLLVTVKRHAGYFFCFNNIAKDLGIQKEKLELKQQYLLQRAKDANNNTEQIAGEARKWLEKAEKHIKEVDNVEAETKKKRKCFLGLCPNCIWQHRLGRKMAKKMEEVVGHHENSVFNYFSRLRSLTRQGLDSSDNFIYFESRNEAYVQLLEALRDSRNFRIGLCGMGGLGKTSLVTKVQKEVMNSKSFDKVVFVVVSNPPDVRKIQEEIAESLGLKFDEQYESNRAKRLHMRLTTGEKILLIIDDIWRPLDFNAIGIPFDECHQGYCRVLLTTREAKVCRSMKCQVKIDLQLLSKKDAWILFKKHANIIEETPPSRLQLARDIADQCKRLPIAIAAVASTLKDQDLQVWKEALTTLKGSKPLDNIDEDFVEIYTCLKLSYDNLKNGSAEKLFLLCSLFPQDYQIPMEDLVRYGIGLGIFGDGDSYETLRFQVCKAAEKLIDSCMLLNASFERESVKMHDLVREVAHWIANKEIQVVVGQEKNLKVVLENIKSRDIVKWLWLHINRIHETQDLLNCSKPNILDPLNWPQLKILVVIVDIDQFVDLGDIFFRGMESLQVLTLIGEVFQRWTTVQISELINLQTLRLKDWELGDISAIGNLRRLKTLELEDCMIIELPDGILELKKLRLLGLFHCSVEKNPFGVMGRFSQLEELYFTKDTSDLQWMIDGGSISEFFDEKCCLIKLKRYQIEIGGDCRLCRSMNYLQPSGLYIECFDASTSNATIKYLVQRAEILHLQDVQGDYKSITPDIVQAVGGLNELIELELDSCLEIECLLDTTNHSSEKGTIFSNLVKLSLETMHSLEEMCHGPSPPDFLQKLETLHLFQCSKLKNLLFVGNLSLCYLKLMIVYDCPALTSLFTLSTAHSLKLLERLGITRCDGLKYIINDQGGSENEDNIVQEKDEHDQKIGDGSVFPKLKYISIDCCDSLEWIFPLSFAGALKQLEEMIVENAAELKNIFGQYQHEDHPLHGNAKEIILPSLRTMSFLDIPNFVSIFPMYYQPSDQPLQSTGLVLTALEEPEKSKYKNLGWVPPAAVTQCLSKQLLNMNTLRVIRLSSVPKLVSLFTLPTAQDMLLECLEISDCHELKHIIAKEEDHDDSNYDSMIVFPKLRTLEVTSCSLLKMLLSVSLAHGLVQLESIVLSGATQLEYVFGHSDHLSHRVEDNIHIEFPALKYLHLAELPRMISICSKNNYPTWPLLKSLRLSECPLLNTSSITDCVTKKGSRENVIEENQSRIEVQALENMLNLEALSIRDDRGLEGIFVLEGLPSSRQRTQWSSSLKSLELKDLSKLRHICRIPLFLSFRNLQYLRVDGCTKLSYVFSACVLRNLPQLSCLFISNCDQLEQIIEDEEVHEACIPKLVIIEIFRCNKLKYLFPVNTPNAFSKLRKLSIEEVSQLVVVFRQKMCNVEHKLTLPSLSSVKLVKLPSLASVCHGFKLQNIEYLHVEDCPKLPDEYQNAGEEESKEVEYREEEEIKEEEIGMKDRNALGLNEVKRPVETILSSNGGKDPHTSINAGMGAADDGRSDVVLDVLPRFSPGPSSETLLSSVSLPPPIHALPSQVDPEEYANFRDIGAVKKKHIPLLEEAITKYPSLWAWRDKRFKHPKMIRFGYDILGDMLEFLASTRWRDLKEDKKAEFDSLVDGLRAFNFDIQWLEKTCAMVEQSRFDEETINRLQTLEAQVMEQETKVKVLLECFQMAEAELNKTKSELDAVRGEVGNFNDFIGF